jgi:hypothetical protein
MDITREGLRKRVKIARELIYASSPELREQAMRRPYPPPVAKLKDKK